MQPIIEVKKDADAVAAAAAQLVLNLVRAAENGSGSNNSGKNDTAAICLSGGNTPRLLYEKLAAAPFAGEMPWQKIHWFWGDERYVPKDDQLSNYRMADEALLAHVPVPQENIHRIKTELPSPEATARDYESELRRYYANGSERTSSNERIAGSRPLFLITLLGLGPDGHTASLFPDTAALSEQLRWATAVEGVKAEPRITLTYPTLNCSRHVIFLVTGKDKQQILQRFIDRDQALPAVQVAPAGLLHVLTDETAMPPASP